MFWPQYWRRLIIMSLGNQMEDLAHAHCASKGHCPLSRWATVGFALLAFILSVAAAVVALWITDSSVPSTIDAISLLVSTPVLVVTLMLASRRSGFSVLAYLGLDIPRRRHIAIAMASLAAWSILFGMLEWALGWNTPPTSMLEIYRSARSNGSLIWLWLAWVVAAPIGEEVLFRGFMFRGFVHAQRNAIPSIVLISLVWSLTHVDYEWFTIAEIFVLGLLLGLVRWSTGSTTLTILLHMVQNLVATIWTEFVLG